MPAGPYLSIIYAMVPACVAGLMLLAPSLILFPNPRPLQSRPARRSTVPIAELDYNNPDVAAEFADCQAMDTEQVEDELGASGVVPPPTMNDMDMRMMLVEMRLRKAGKLGSQKATATKKPPAGANAFEMALYEKPAFKELYERYKQTRDTNAANLATEHLIDARRAKERYGGTAKYDETIAEIEAALNAKVEQKVSSGKVAYAGFPANMGEGGVRMTLATFGDIVDLTFAENDDGTTCAGQVEFETVDAAKAAIDKYDGVDMGLGTTLELRAL